MFLKKSLYFFNKPVSFIPLKRKDRGIMAAKVGIFSNHLWILVSLYQQGILAAQKKIFYANKKYKVGIFSQHV